MVRLEIYGLLFDVLKKNGDMTNMVKKFNIKNKYIYMISNLNLILKSVRPI
jgi:hypothetical protein